MLTDGQKLELLYKICIVISIALIMVYFDTNLR